MPDKSQKSENATQHSRRPMPLLLRVSLWTVIILHILVFILFRLQSNYLPDRKQSKPYVTFVSRDSFAKDAELEEYAMLFDSAPLFIPTHMNASQLVEVDFENASMGKLPEFEPKIELLNELEPEGLLKEDSYKIKEPSDLLASRFWRFFEGFGRSAEDRSPYERTMPVAEISIIGEFRNPVVLLNVDLEPAASFSIPRPVSYTIRKSDNRLIEGTPMLTESSDNETFDKAVARWLQRPDVIAKLPTGYLLIRVFFW